VSEVVLSLSHQRGKKPTQTKPNQTNKKHHKVPQVQMQYSYSKFFSMQVYFSCCLIRGRKKKKSLETVCEWLSVAVAHLPAAVSLLLLEALFMQISRVSLTLT
jgi:hypothetical protein